MANAVPKHQHSIGLAIGKTKNANLGVMQSLSYYNNLMRIKHRTIPHIYGGLFEDWVTPASWDYMDLMFLNHPKANYEICKKGHEGGFPQLALYIVYTFTLTNVEYYIDCHSTFQATGFNFFVLICYFFVLVCYFFVLVCYFFSRISP